MPDIVLVEYSTSAGQLRCSFCGKGYYQVRELIAGPGLYVCDQCIGLCAEVLSKAERSNTTINPPTSIAPPHCNFCGESRSEMKRVVAGPGVYICDVCVERCQQLLESSSASPSRVSVRPSRAPSSGSSQASH